MSWLAMAAVVMSAFYIFRALIMTFYGEFRGGADSDPDATESSGAVHPSESPASMVAPLVVLGVAAVLAGFFVNPAIDLGLISSHALTDFLDGGPVSVIHESFSFSLAGSSTLMAISGIALAYLMYSLKCISPERTAEPFRPAYPLLSRQ